jgi:hypothetical protein
MKKYLIGALVASAMITTPAFAKDKANNGQANGQGCNSQGAPNSANPGAWLRGVRERLEQLGFGSLTPAEMAALENETAGWDGYGESGSVGDFIKFFCGKAG